MNREPRVVSIDIGLNGAIFGSHLGNKEPIKMPTIKIETKKPVKVLNLKDGKKQFYKSGPNKGEPIYKIKTPAKYKKELDCKSIYNLLLGSEFIVIESPNHTHGARSAATTHKNYGKILALAELVDAEVVIVAASKWKKDLDLPSDKEPCVVKAEELSGLSFKKENGTLMHDEAESCLLSYWFMHYGIKNI